MKICFLTKEPAVCRMIAARLKGDGVESSVCDDAMGFYNDIMNNTVASDLVVCDYRLFQLSMYNFCEFVSQRPTVTPFIFYNDPHPDKDSRIMYWIAQLEQVYNCANLDTFDAIFAKINDAIEDPSIKPYISLLQPPLPVPGSEADAGTAGRQIDLRLFRKRNSLQPGLFKLFKIFYENQMQELSLKELSRQMWGKTSKSNTVYSYISRLRKCIEQDHLVKIDITRTAPGLYEMVVY